MQNPIQKFGQSSVVLKKPGILSESLKILTYTVEYVFAETSHTFSTYQCLQKGVQDFFYLF